MELYILNTYFQPVTVIDRYSSLIWTKRYFDTGDFELCIPADETLLNFLKIGYYISRKECECTMIIERIEIKTDVENGNYFLISGRSAESILSYRIVTSNSFGASNPVQMCFWLIRLEAMGVDTTYGGREIDIIKNVSFFSMDYNEIFWNTHETENLLDAVFSICKSHGFSFKFLLRDSRDGFDVVFYKGIDRTSSQTDNTPIIFSPVFYNLINSQYVIDSSQSRNMAFVLGEDENKNKSYVWTNKEDGKSVPVQLDRRELFVSAVNVKQKDITFEEFIDALKAKGKEELFKTEITEGLSGEVDTSLQFVYRRDWNLGDIVSIENEYGIKATARIVEVIESDDESGFKITPTFSEWEMI